jgi:hypothetical protein
MKTGLSLLNGAAATALISLALCAPAEAQTQAQSDELGALHAEIEALRAEVAEMRAAQQAASAPAPTAPAATASAQVASTQPHADNWFDDTRVSGRMYFNISHINREVDGTTTESGSGFTIKRFYLGVDHRFSPIFSANVTADIDSVASTSGSLVGRGFYVKKAYLQASLDPAFNIRLGSADMPWVPYAEGAYGLRYIEQTLIDRTKFGTSADWGVHLFGDLAGGLLSYQVSAVDGGGYRDPHFSNHIDFEGRLSAQYHGFSAAIGGYTGRLGKDVDGGAPVRHTATRLNALIGYRNSRFSIGGEYFWARNWNQITAVPRDTSDGWSVFGTFNITPRLAVFGRYDWESPRRDTTLPETRDRYFNVGLQYEPYRNIDLALVYKRDRVANGILNTGNGNIGGVNDGTYDEFGFFGQFRF